MGKKVTRAVDTNVVIRYLTNDDPVQTPVATETLRVGFILPVTVLMESEWVLRSYYRWPRDRIFVALSDLIDLPSAVHVPEGARWALSRFAEGAEMADMLHVAAAIGANKFLTFDTDIEHDAGPDTPIPIETLA
jgi:predicted nucleic-acid-binding protein